MLNNLLKLPNSTKKLLASSLILFYLKTKQNSVVQKSNFCQISILFLRPIRCGSNTSNKNMTSFYPIVQTPRPWRPHRGWRATWPRPPWGRPCPTFRLPWPTWLTTAMTHWFDPIWSDLIQFDPIWSDLIRFDPIWWKKNPTIIIILKTNFQNYDCTMVVFVNFCLRFWCEFLSWEFSS